MQVHEIPREYKGEGRILYIFSTKALIFTAAAATIGVPFFLILKMFGFTIAGLIVMLLFALIGFSIGTFKVPESQAFSITRKTGGERIEDVIRRWIKFKKKKNRIYIFKDERINKEEGTNE